MSALTDRYGKTALVTGASSGIGRAFAERLAAEGFHLLLTARRGELLQTLATELQARFGVEVSIHVADLACRDDIAALLQACSAREIDLLVSNAGFGLKGGYCEDELQRILDMVHTNSLAPTILCHSLLPAMAARGRGAVILTGSVEGEMGFPWSTAYAATKAYVHSLGGGLWGEYQGTGVDVLVLAPGPTDTDAPTLQGISRDQMVNMMPPQRVAEEALAQLGRHPLWIPGFSNRLMIAVLSRLPRRWTLRLTGMGMKRAIDASRRSKAGH